jgi:homoserine trans-succinylase
MGQWRRRNHLSTRVRSVLYCIRHRNREVPLVLHKKCVLTRFYLTNLEDNSVEVCREIQRQACSGLVCCGAKTTSRSYLEVAHFSAMFIVVNNAQETTEVIFVQDKNGGLQCLLSRSYIPTDISTLLTNQLQSSFSSLFLRWLRYSVKLPKPKVHHRIQKKTLFGQHASSSHLGNLFL